MATDQFSADEIHWFFMNTYNIQRLVITGTEQFPGKFLNPQRLNSSIFAEMLDILVEYYKTVYELMNFRKLFTADLDNSITVQGQINQYGRCQIGSEIFGSAMSSQYIKSSFVLAQFINQDGSVEMYPGQI